MRYDSRYIPLVDLNLDTQNPRFVVVPNPDEVSIMEYLIQYENVLDIAKGINDDSGLMPGERIIVCEENGKFVVLEGNRRICACKLLIGLLKTNRKIPKITEETMGNISNIHVDFVESRQSIQAALYKRHLIGIKSWSTEAKQFFFANRFLKGESIENISADTNSTPSTVRKAIQGYNLVHYALNISLWSESEKRNLDHNKLELDRFLRPFNSKSKKYDANARTLLKISYDEKDQLPYSEFGKLILDKGLYILAKAAFITGELTTRKYVEDIPEFVELINNLNTNEVNSSNNGDIDTDLYEDNPEADFQDSKDSNTSNQDSNSSNTENANTRDSNTEKQDPRDSSSDKQEDSKNANGDTQDTKNTDTTQNNPTVFTFFEGLNWTALTYNDPQDIGLMLMAKEIMKISKYKHYSWYPISATILMRALLEQSLKFHIRKMGLWDDLTKKNQGRDPMLSQIIRYYKDNKRYMTLFIEKPIYSAFLNAVSEDNITFMDTVVHSTETIVPSKEKLESIAKSGMFQVINFILNEKKHWPS